MENLEANPLQDFVNNFKLKCRPRHKILHVKNLSFTKVTQILKIILSSVA